ncbi:MAG: DNA polymerase Y family protein [Betaproteobacteria bacterium]|nr:DNA polymerase Y family protein [Betaproteobacteria bacterium]
MRWIAIHLPQLPLEVFLRGTPAPEPFAVADSRGFIIACDRKAALRGIVRGMAAPAALALAARLVVRPRDPAAETEAVLGVAAWAAQFTPAVSIALPDGVLLDVEGSLQLFGGMGNIIAALQSGLADMGFSATLAVAPTPLAAAWSALVAVSTPAASATPVTAAGAASARATGKPPLECERRRVGGPHGAIPAAVHALEPPQLEAVVAALPLVVLQGTPGIDADALEALRGLGIATLGQVQALPRDGVARRFGQLLLDTLDRSCGRLPDPRTPFRLPERFHAGIELPFEVTQAEALLFAARRLLVQLAGFLAARASGVQRIAVRLIHRDAVTEVPIGMVAPSRDSAHFALLLRERLASLANSASLREPVRSITVSAGDIVPLAGERLGLFADDAVDAIAPGSWEKLIERLRARLGTQAVLGLAAADEHRPERASISAEPDTGQPRPSQLSLRLPQEALPPGERPFWLLEEPRPLRELASVPHHEGPLELLAGPERIETGWWDAGEIARDYFVARSPERSLLWIYRERKALDAEAGWYLHGIFA